MHQILVYGDSLTWGIVPLTRKRLPFDKRWPGVMEHRLEEHGLSVRVIEDCLNGRRTVWDDPFKPGRNGLEGLAQRIECHSPLSLVIVMLGTNDFQSMHPHSAWHSALGIATLVNAIRQAPIEPEMPKPPVLVVVPPPIETPKGPIAMKFIGGDSKCVGLADALRTTCEQLECSFFDSATVISSSKVDGVHLDADHHQVLGEAVAKVVIPLLQKSN